jgi:transcriptional regulator with XRE-family HTH domain
MRHNWRMKERHELIEALRAKRLERGLTQQQLADAAGIPRRTYQRLEGGHAGTSTDSLLLALRALGLKVDLTPRRRPALDQLATIYGNEELDQPAAG